MEGDSNEEMQAGAGQEAGAGAVSEKPEKRKSQALVSGGGDPPAGGEGAEQPEEPSGETGEGAGVVNDGMAKSGNDPDDRLAGKMGAAAELAEGDTAADGAGDGGASGNPQPDSEANLGGGNDGADGEGAAADPGPAEIVYGDPQLDLSSLALYAASQAYVIALANADAVRRLMLGDDAVPPKRSVSPDMMRDMAAFVRKIGQRATTEVVGQQLRILRHRQTPDLSHSEVVAVSAFIHVLRELDGLAADEQAKIDKAEALKARVEPEPLPIAETTMELVNGPMDTWVM